MKAFVHTFIASCFLLCYASAWSQWSHGHPGGGGQIQAINLDPWTPGRAYLHSDVEGNYRTDDYGRTWEWIGKTLIHHMSFTTAVEPGHPSRIYTGTAYGLHVSDDAGQNYTFLSSHAQVAGSASATSTILIHPSQPSTIYTLNGWFIKDSGVQNLEGQTEQPTQTRFGVRNLFKSTDRGATWNALTYESGSDYRHAYSLEFDPADATAQTLYLGAFSGLYRTIDGGTNWTKLPAPSAYTDPSCRGATVTPDGKFIFAVWGQRHPADDTTAAVTTRVLTTPWVARVGVWNWTQLASPADPNGLYFPLASINEYWKPIIDPRSGVATHGLSGTYQFLLGCMASSADTSQGLFLGTFTRQPDDQTVVGSFNYAFKQSVGANRNQQGWVFDMGWNNISPQCRQYALTPTTWPVPRGLWVASQQSLYIGEIDATTRQVDRDSYLVRSTEPVSTIAETTFYKNRGFSSTVNFDNDAYQNYVVQSMADNCLLESWDGGVSWTQAFSPLGTGSGDAVHILRPEGAFAAKPAYVLAAVAPGPGGGTATSIGSLRAKAIVLNPTTTAQMNAWSSIAGNSGGTAGINENTGTVGAGQRIYSIESHSANRGLVFLGTQTGLFFIDNIYPLIESGTGSFAKITSGSLNITRVWPDPADQNRIYYYVSAGTLRGLYRATRSAGTWTTAAIAVSQNMREAAYWRSGSTEYLAYALSDTGSNPGAQLVFASNNGGTSFQGVMTHQQILDVHPEPWWEQNGTQMAFNTVGLVGYGSKLIASTHVEFGKHGYALIELTLGGAPGSITASRRDWTGLWPLHGYMHMPRIWRAKAIAWNGETYYAAATRGGGLWWRQLSNPPMTYPDWTHASGLALPTAQPDYDPDADGSSNLLEYALGTSPSSAASIATPTAGISGDVLTFSFLRARPELTYEILASNDLHSWHSVATNPGSVSLTTPFTFADSVNLSSAHPPRRFLRLQVHLP